MLLPLLQARNVRITVVLANEEKLSETDERKCERIEADTDDDHQPYLRREFECVYESHWSLARRCKVVSLVQFKYSFSSTVERTQDQRRQTGDDARHCRDEQHDSKTFGTAFKRSHVVVDRCHDDLVNARALFWDEKWKMLEFLYEKYLRNAQTYQEGNAGHHAKY